MLNLPQRTIDKIKNLLLRQQEEIKSQLKDLEDEDPVLSPGVAEASEPGTDSWKQDIHNRFLSLKDDLLELSKKTRDSLSRLSSGTYGKCEKCSNTIEAERLELVPTATLCISCSKKSKKS